MSTISVLDLHVPRCFNMGPTAIAPGGDEIARVDVARVDDEDVGLKLL